MKLPEADRGAGERPGTLADAQAAIAETLAMVDGLNAGAPNKGADEPMAHELPNGRVFDMTAGQYARDWTLPQFYFHVVAAYAILRAEGVELRKADYVAHLMPFIRPDTMPTG